MAGRVARPFPENNGNTMQQQQGPSPALFFEAANAFQRTEALRAAIELDLFTHIASGHHAADRLAAACGASERGVRILADYLVIAGFLRKSDGRYELTSDSQVFLTRSSPAYLGGHWSSCSRRNCVSASPG